MKTITIKDYAAGLQAAAKQQGAKGVEFAKSLMLNGVMLVDEAGNPVDPESVDITLTPAVGEKAQDMVEAEEEEDEEETEKAIAKSVRKHLAAERSQGISVPRGIVQAGDSPRRVYKSVRHFKSSETAFRFGQFLLGASGNRKSAQWCLQNGVFTKAHVESVNSQGGYLVPEEFEQEIITLREQYGVFRANARVVPMSRDTKWMPRRTGGLTAYWVGETAAGQESTQSFDRVQLVARKLMVLTTVSTELDEDAITNMGDDAAQEIAYEFAKREDEAGFNGDGTSSYGGIVGLANTVGTAGVADSGLGTSDIANLTMAMVAKMFAKLPNWAQGGNVKLYCHKSVYHEAFERLAMSAGGVTAAEIASGYSPRFFGYPVVISQALPTTATTTDGTVLAYFGDLSQGCYFGDRREITIKTSDSALNAFEQDEVALKGTQRVDIVCANVGSASEAGAVIKFTR